ncbi:MAG: glycosyltransferase family 4 protein [bacterium]
MVKLKNNALKGRKIGLLHYSCPPVIGGAEFILEAHARWLNRYGADVRILVGEGEQFHDDIPVETLDVLQSDYPGKKEIRRGLLKGEHQLFEEKKEEIKGALEEKFSNVQTWLVHNLYTMSFNLPATAALFELAGETSAQVIPWVHDIAWLDDEYDTPDKYPWTLLKKPAEVDSYVGISGLRERQLTELFGDEVPIEVIHDGIEFYEFQELDPAISAIYSAHRMYLDDAIAVYPARIVKRKNFELALEIVHHLKKIGYSLHFIITGPPDPHNPESMNYFDKLKQMRADLDLEDEVIFCYELDNPETGEPLKVSYNRVRQFYRLSDILLMTSRQEGFGLPLLEAGLSKTLICCSNIEPLPEVGGEAPIYFDPDEHPSIIAYEIYQKLETQASVKLQRRVRKKFTWPAIFESQFIPFLTEQYPPTSG